MRLFTSVSGIGIIVLLVNFFIAYISFTDPKPASVYYKNDTTKIQQAPNLTLLKGTVVDEESKKPIEARIEIFNNDSNLLVSAFRSNASTGKYLVSLPSGVNYGINVNADNYLFYSENINLTSAEGFQEIVKNIELRKIRIGNSMILNNVFFEFDKANISPQSKPELDNIKKLMLDYEKLMIEISGHTDSIGDYKYNLKLSQRRASAVVNYLIKEGVDPSRLMAKGSGPLKPIAPNSMPDGSDNPEGRAMNRRTEFKVIGK